MRKLLAYGLSALLTLSPALAAPQGTVNLASPGGTVGMTGDGTNLMNIGELCGAASATLYATCVNNLIINSSGQALVLATITGTLPAFTATPTFNLGTLNGAATAALQTAGNTTLSTINTTLGSPMQTTGGSVGISGNLPSFASTPTFNCGTGCSGTSNNTPISPPTSGTGMAPFTVTAGTPVTTTIAPTGQSTLVIVSANATSNTAHCTLGASVASSDPTIVPGSQTAFAIGAATQFTCSVSAGSQVISPYAGTGALQSTNGLPPNVGAAGTSLSFAQTMQGSTGGVPVNSAIAAGGDVSEGNITDTAWSGTGNSTAIAALKAIYTAVTGSIAAGTNLIGGVNIGQWGGTNITNVPTAVGTAGTGNTPTVNAYIVGGAGSGGTAGADAATFTAGTTNMTPAGCEFTSGGATAIVTGHMAMVGCTAARAQLTDKSSVGGTAITAAVSALGTAATGTAVENVNAYIVGGAGSGGTAAADAAAWTAGTTLQTAQGCEFTTGGATALVTAHMGTVGCTSARALFSDKSSVAGTALTAAVSAYGTAPTGTAVEGINAFVTNTNANGPATAANSSPVVVQGQQATGSALSNNNPVLTGGSDGTNARSFLTSTTGHLVIDCGSAGGSCSGSGGTSSSFGSAFPATGTAIGLTSGTNMVAWSATTNYGTAPSAIAVPAVNAAVTNSITIGTNAALVAGAATIGKVDILGNAGGTLDTAAGTAASTGLSVQGMSAAGATFSDAPMGNGLNAITTNPTALTNGQKVKQMGDVQGKNINLPYSPAALANNGQGSSTTTAAITVQAASGSASFKEYMTSLSCSRNDAGTTAITVAISDGTTTVTKALPNNGGGGTVTWPFPVPRAWAANTAVTVTPSAGVTTLNCDATGFNAT